MANFPTVLILAGGLGTRVKDLNPQLPKAMLPICGEPFIAHQLRLLAKQSVEEVILCVGHCCQPIIDYVGSGKKFGIRVHYSHDGETLRGTGGAIRHAIEIHDLKKSLAVLYGDSYLETDFTKIYNAFQKHGTLGLMSVYKNHNKWISSNVSCQDGLVTGYSKTSEETDKQYVDYGLSIFQSLAFLSFSVDKSFDLKEVFLTLVKEKQLAAYEVKERFYETGSLAGIKEFTEHLMRKR